MYAPHTSRQRTSTPGYAARTALNSARERNRRYTAYSASAISSAPQLRSDSWEKKFPAALSTLVIVEPTDVAVYAID